MRIWKSQNLSEETPFHAFLFILCTTGLFNSTDLDPPNRKIHFGCLVSQLFVSSSCEMQA